MKEKKYIILIDIKEFTYKNTLLTDKQVWEILTTFESIVTGHFSRNNISIIKSIWDAYLCFAHTPKDAYEFTRSVISQSQKYDKKERVAIKKLSLRASICYGDVTKNKTMDLDDYFGDPINLASRMMPFVPSGEIFIDGKAHAEIRELGKTAHVCDHLFHGIIEQTSLYSLDSSRKYKQSDIFHDNKTLLQSCDEIVFRSACVSAILSAQPLPFIENFNIIGVHLYMILKISQQMWRWVSLRSSWEICKKVVSPLWIWYFSMQWANTLLKIVLPGFGWYLFSPVSFAVTYGVWKVYTAYFMHEISGEDFTKDDIIGVFKRQRHMGKEIAKKERKSILQTGKKFYKDILSIKESSWYSDVQKDLIVMLKSDK